MSNAAPFPVIGAELLAAVERMTEQLDVFRVLRRANPDEAQKMAARIEVLEKQFAKFLADTDKVANEREVVKEALLKCAAGRSALEGREEPAN